MPSPRLLHLACALVAAGLLGYGYWLQFHDGLEPCPMCVFQRLCYMALVAVSGAAAVHGARGTAALVYAGLGLLTALTGGGIAARQVWLQHLPPELVPECGPGLEFWLDTLPIAEVIAKALRGTGECASVDWTFLGLSIAEWSLACFAGFALVYLWILRAQRRGARPPA